MATLRNVDDTGVPGCEREAAPHQKGEALLPRKQEFSRKRVSSVIVRRPVPPLPSLMPLKKTCLMKNFNHTQRSREHAIKPGASPRHSATVSCRHGRLICPSFPFFLLEYFKENLRHHVILPSCTSVCIKKNLYVSFYFQNMVLTGAPHWAETVGTQQPAVS